MSQMMLSYKRQFRRFDAGIKWLIWSMFFLYSTFVVCEERKARACSNTVTGSCNFFNVSCDQGERIQILEAVYVSERDKNATIHQHKCPIFTLVCDKPLQCCPEPPGNKLSVMNYSNSHLYSLLQECSWEQTCEAKAPFIDLGSSSCSITYTCEPEKNTARFCTSSNVSASKLNMVFENSTDLNKTDLAICQCFIASNGSFTVKTLDVRLQNATGSCSEGKAASLSGFHSNGNISCSEDFQNVRIQQVVSEMRLLLTIYSANKPQMVLVEASGNSDSTVTAQCLAPNQPFPTTEASNTPPRQNPTVASLSSPQVTAEYSSASLTLMSTTSARAKSYTTSTKSYQTTLSHSTTMNIHANNSDNVAKTSTRTFQNQASSSHPDGFEARVNNSDDVPVAAIVLPIIAVLLSGVGIVFIIWRKRYSRNSETKFSKKYKAQTAVGNVDHKAAYLNTPVITGHSNNMQESESTYTYIDHGDSIQFKGVQNRENGHKVTPKLTPECFAEKHVISPLSEQKFINRDAERRGTNYINETINRNYNSAVNHSQNENFLPSSSKINDNNRETSSHDYFVLEAQNFALNTSEFPALNKPKNLDITEREETPNPDYLELDPDDTYTGIDPDDVTVQTLDENEYNTINLKKKIISRDENYGALNFDMNPRNIQDTCEYSHFRINPSDQKSNVNEYSQVQFDKVRHDTSGSEKTKKKFLN